MEPYDNGVTLVGMITLLRTRWMLVAAGPVLAVILATLVILFAPRDYVAYSEFLPEKTDAMPGGASAIASQFGISLGTGSGESPYLYLHILTARELLDTVVLTKYAYHDARLKRDVSGNLIELLYAKGDNQAEKLSNAIKKLSEKGMYATVEPRANMVLLQTRAKSPILAEQINRRLLNLVNEFNLNRRQTRAKAERKFVESRMANAQSELRAAEGRLARFFEENRRYQQSAPLVLQEERLSREVAQRQQVYTTLAQGYEQARIEEVRNTPAMTVVSSPEGSGRRATSPLKLIALALVAGTLASIALVFVLEALDRFNNATQPGRLRTV